MGIKRNALATVFGAASLLVAGAASASNIDFEYRVDSFSVNGNVDNFNNLNNWFKQWGTVSASNGYAILQSPGTVVTRSGVNATFHMSNIIYKTAQSGTANYTAQSVWSSAYLPEAPGGFFGQYFNDQTTHTTFSINLSNFDQAAASAIGNGALVGLAMSFSEVDGAGNTLHAQQVSITSQPITGDLVMRLLFDKTTNLLNAAYSLDGGTTFQSPFSGLSSSGRGFHVLAGDPLTVNSVPVPASFGLLGSALLGLVGMKARKSRA